MIASKLTFDIDHISKRIRTLQQKSQILFARHQFTEILINQQILQHLLEQYYQAICHNSIVTASIKHIILRQKLKIIYNRIVIYLKNSEHQRAKQSIIAAILKIQTNIQQERVSFGLYDLEDRLAMRHYQNKIIQLQSQLAKYYYLASVVSFQLNQQTHFSKCIRKSIEIVKQSYCKLREIQKFNHIQQKAFIQDELFSLQQVIQLKQKACFTRRIGLTTVKNLTQKLNLLREVKSQQNSEYDYVIEMNRQQLANVQLLSSQQLQREFSCKDILAQIKQVHFFNLIAEIRFYESVAQNRNQDEIYQKINLQKNIILLKIMALFIYKKTLPTTRQANRIIDSLFKSKLPKDTIERQLKTNIIQNLFAIYQLNNPNIAQLQLKNQKILNFAVIKYKKYSSKSKGHHRSQSQPHLNAVELLHSPLNKIAKLEKSEQFKLDQNDQLKNNYFSIKEKKDASEKNKRKTKLVNNSNSKNIAHTRHTKEKNNSKILDFQKLQNSTRISNSRSIAQIKVTNKKACK